MAENSARAVFVTSDDFVILEGDFHAIQPGDRYTGGTGPAIDLVELTIETICCSTAIASIAALRGRVKAKDLPGWTLRLETDSAGLVQRS